MSLFESDHLASQDDADRPLAERMRPATLDEYVGQEHILAPGKPLRSQIDRDQLGSIILWGPPGVGKTTLARIIARMTHADFIPFSAVLSGIKEIKAVMSDAERNRRLGRRTLIFIDEIHRFNKAQQDAFLPYVERGDIILIGATTENPSFEVISALLSRTKVYMLKPLAEDEIVRLLQKALPLVKVTASEDLLRQIAVYSNGDARTAYNILELAAAASTDGTLGGAGGGRCDAAQDAALRQIRRGTFQPDLGAAQIGAVKRCGCGAVLAGADAGSGRGPDVYRAAAGADGD